MILVVFEKNVISFGRKATEIVNGSASFSMVLRNFSAGEGILLRPKNVVAIPRDAFNLIFQNRLFQTISAISIDFFPSLN